MEWLPWIGVKCVCCRCRRQERVSRSEFQASSDSDCVAVLLTLIRSLSSTTLYLTVVIPQLLYRLKQDHNLPTIAAVYSWVDALPPKSPVVALPSAIVFQAPVVNTRPPTQKCSRTASIAFSILSACSLRFMCLNIISEDNKSAVGLAKPLPGQTSNVSDAGTSPTNHIPAISGA